MDPLKRLQQLPWLKLFQVAVLTAIAVLVLEYLLWVLSIQIPGMRNLLILALSPTFGFITAFAVALGVGALAVLILERFQRIVINAGVLWGLGACVAIALFLLQILHLFPIGLVGIGETQLIGILLGIFFKGQPYWKSYRRW